MPRCFTLVVATALSLFTRSALGKGDGGFQAPLSINSPGRSGPVTIHTGDLDSDGKLDIVAANSTSTLLLLFQNPSNRNGWRQVPLKVGTATYFSRTGDFDGDGRIDIVAADTASSAYLVRNRGDGGFDPPRAVPQTGGARWLATGDWNRDGNLDLVTANLDAGNITIFVGDGAGGFSLSQKLAGSREHTIEALDWDGDGILDLILGTGIPGLTPYRGAGNGTFVAEEVVPVLGCVEYISIGDLNRDGKDDLTTTCIDFSNAFLGISLGDGSFRKALETQAGGGTDSTAIGDLDGDGWPDVACVSAGYTTLLVFLNKGEAAGNVVQPPVSFGPTGLVPDFLLVEDLDRDGHNDVISSDQNSSSVTIFWGKGGERFLESGYAVKGVSQAKAMAIADLDRDGFPDLIFPRSTEPKVDVFLKPGGTAPARPSFTLATANKYSALEAVDLDGDGLPDLAGASETAGTLQVALLGIQGGTLSVRSETSLDAGLLPTSVRAARIDAGDSIDLAVPCKGSDRIAIYLNSGGGQFAAARNAATVVKAKRVAIGDLDRDGIADLLVSADTAVVFHFGLGGGDFGAPQTLIQDLARLFNDVAIAELNGDAFPDLLVCEQKTSAVLLFPGRGDRSFGGPVPLAVGTAPVTLAVADLDGDGLLDFTTGNITSRSVSAVLNLGGGAFTLPVTYGMGVPLIGHRLADLDQDGALDIVGFTSSSAMILLGRSAGEAAEPFRRGDATGEGTVDLSDAIFILAYQFTAGPPPGCPDAADTDDSGRIDVSDPVFLLGYLFLAGPPPPAPGPLGCGADGTPDDTLSPCAGACR